MDDEPPATQPIEDDVFLLDDEEEVPPARLVRMASNTETDMYEALPGEQEVLVLGRLVSGPTRLEEGVTKNVRTVLLIDYDRAADCQLVSRQQAEVRWDGGALVLQAKGTRPTFVNGAPLWSAATNGSTRASIFDGDVIRLGGGYDGRPDAGYDKFVYKVVAPAVGGRRAPRRRCACRCASACGGASWRSTRSGC